MFYLIFYFINIINSCSYDTNKYNLAFNSQLIFLKKLDNLKK